MSGGRYLRLIPGAVALLLLRAQPPAANTYVDSHQCAECHSQIARTYALTGMARSFYRFPTSNPPEDFQRGNPFHHQLSDTWYAMVRHDGKMYQRRWRIGPGGQEVAVQEASVDYVMGSGNHVRTYLHRTERGALIELPLAWYAENGGVWAMGPGLDRDYLLPPRTIAYECMFCHNAYPTIPAGHDEPGAEPLYTGALPEGVDCQRCHGPGSNHVRAARQGGKAETVRAAIVNPARLNSERQMEVCLQCHLETTSQPLPHSVLKFDRAPFSYRPGEPLGNFLLFFDRATGKHDDFEIAHSAYRLRKSLCFLRSAGKMTCTTCHDPHDVPRGASAAAHYNAVCSQCHAAAFQQLVAAQKHTAATDCIACHMPKRRTQDVVNAVMTDHFIQRRPPAGDLLAQIPERPDFDANRYHGEVAAYYPLPLPPTAENLLYQAVAQVSQKSNLAAGLPKLAAEVARQKPANAGFYVELGQAWIGAGKPANAIPPFEEAARRKPASPVVLLNLADGLSQDGQLDKALGVLQRAVKAAPSDALLWYQMAVTQSSAGRDAEAIAALEKAATLDPEMAEAHNLLGEHLAATGDLERAASELQAALAINPDFPEALGNYGHLCAARHDYVQAIYYFARSVHLHPKAPDVLTNYAVALAGLNRFAEAQQQIEAALQADPRSPDAHNFRGVLLDRQGLRAEALREFLEAVRLRPDFDLARFNAGRILASQGDLAAAEAQLRRAAAGSDPNVQRQAVTLLRQLGR